MRELTPLGHLASGVELGKGPLILLMLPGSCYGRKEKKRKKKRREVR